MEAAGRPGAAANLAQTVRTTVTWTGFVTTALTGMVLLDIAKMTVD